MISSILGLLNYLFEGLTKWMDYLHDQSLKQAGSNEVEIKDLREQNENLQIASEVDSRPTPSDDSVLDGLRDPHTD